MFIKKNFKISIILLSTASFLFGVVLTSEYYKREHRLEPTTQNISSKKETSNENLFIGEYAYPYDKTKQIKVQGDYVHGYEITYRSGKNQSKIMTTSGPYGFVWSDNSQTIAFTNHDVSNHDSVHIVNLLDGKEVLAEGEDQFVQSQKNPGDYTHIYTRTIGWYDNDSLIISVSGHPDSSSFQPKSQLFLVDANSGKVIKRVL